METARTCTRCGAVKSIENFAKDNRSKGGRRRQCRNCRQEHIRRWQRSEHGKAWMKAYGRTKAGKAAKSRGNKKWRQSQKGKAYDKRTDVLAYRAKKSKNHRQRHPLKTAAREAVKQARRRKEIPEPSTLRCEGCAGPASEYHHHKGYSRKNHMNVIPVCRHCHRTVFK